jgi:hypothetical protein
MMKYKTSELEGALLDAAVAQAEGFAQWRVHTYEGEPDTPVCILGPVAMDRFEWSPSEAWEQGGPIIERNLITVAYDYKTAQWGGACCDRQGRQISAFHYRYPLIAAMRAYVASKLGEEVEL